MFVFNLATLATTWHDFRGHFVNLGTKRFQGRKRKKRKKRNGIKRTRFLPVSQESEPNFRVSDELSILEEKNPFFFTFICQDSEKIGVNLA